MFKASRNALIILRFTCLLKKQAERLIVKVDFFNVITICFVTALILYIFLAVNEIKMYNDKIAEFVYKLEIIEQHFLNKLEENFLTENF